MKLFICGRGANHRSKDHPESTGKDTLAEVLNDRLGLSYISSSEIMCRKVIWPMFKDKYYTWQDCFADRHSENNRQIFFDIISKYNEHDKSKLSKLIFSEVDVYVGIRNHTEFLASKHLADLSIWVDAAKRIELEDNTSCTITPDMCDIIIDNNGTLKEYIKKIDRLCHILSSTNIQS